KVAPDIPTLADWMKTGQADLFFDSPYPALAVSDLSGGQPILRRWKGGVSEYHSVIFVRADSGFTSVNDLVGKKIAFQDASSTSGYMLPLSYLIQANLNPVEIANPDAAVAAGNVGYLFSGADENSIDWVLSGRVAAAATDNVSYGDIPEDTRNGL